MGPIRTEIVNELRTSSKWTSAAGIGLIIAGILALSAPLMSALAATLVFGGAAIFAGVVEGSFAWRTRHEGGAFWRFAASAVLLAAGLAVFSRPDIGVAALALAMGVGLIARGVVLAVVSYRLRSTPGWGWLLFDAAVSLLLGILAVYGWPAATIIYLGCYVGVSLVAGGVTRVIEGRMVRRALPPPEMTGRPTHA